jgi:hypothetical protein
VHWNFFNNFVGPAEETGTRAYDITAGPPQHTLQQQEADCLQDEPGCWRVDIWLQKITKGALLMVLSFEVLVTK